MQADPSGSVLAFFGSELRRYRFAAGMSQPELGRACWVSGSLIRMIESAQRTPSFDLAGRADAALGTDGMFTRLWPLVGRDSYPTWFQAFADLEREATSLREFMPLGIPGLLQTEDYARALFRSGRPWDTAEQIEELVNARMARQAILSGEHPPMLRVVIDESALRRPIGNANGGPAVMAAQLDALIEAAQRTRIVVQVVPLNTGEHVGLAGGFTVASFADAPDIAYVDNVIRGQIMDRSDDVAECAAVFHMLQAAALSPDASLDLMMRIRKEG